MSFIVGRLAAGKEGAYFLQESKHAVGRLVEKTNKSTTAATNRPPAPTIHEVPDNQSDILPEILKHNLPSRIFRPPSDSTLSNGSKWLLNSDESNGVSSVSRDAINPLRAYVSLPQVTFGPKRYFSFAYSVNLTYNSLDFWTNVCNFELNVKWSIWFIFSSSKSYGFAFWNARTLWNLIKEDN